MRRAVIVALVLSLASSLGAAEPFRFRDGDRVVLIGSTLIEREQKYGYWETALTSAFPNLNLTFRNLGWSGDTVWGESRAGFNTQREGYKRLVEQTLAQKPTVLVVGYGTNESFAGAPGLQAFRDQLNKLLDDLAPSQAHVILLALPRVDEARAPKDAPADRAQDVTAYAGVVRDVARQRQALYLDPFGPHDGSDPPQTADCTQLTPHCYYRSIGPLLDKLVSPLRLKSLVELDGTAPKRHLQEFLPRPPAPPDMPGDVGPTECRINARNLKLTGRYALKIDGKPVHTAEADAWMRLEGIAVPRGPSVEQAERLRQAIVEKNRQFFYRWRPQNETYLFGFRRHEQGQNAQEIPRFDPLIEKLEQDIARLRVPVEHAYELTPAP